MRWPPLRWCFQRTQPCRGATRAAKRSRSLTPPTELLLRSSRLGRRVWGVKETTRRKKTSHPRPKKTHDPSWHAPFFEPGCLVVPYYVDHRRRAAAGGCTTQDGYITKDARLERPFGETDAPPIEPVELRRCGSRLGEDSSCTLALLKRSIESAPGTSASRYLLGWHAHHPRQPHHHEHAYATTPPPRCMLGAVTGTYFPYLLWARPGINCFAMQTRVNTSGRIKSEPPPADNHARVKNMATHTPFHSNCVLNAGSPLAFSLCSRHSL